MDITAEPDLLIGRQGADHVALSVVSRPYADAGDDWDVDWLVAPVEISVGSFRGSIRTLLRASELQRFRLALEELDKTAKGQAKFESIETWLMLSLAATTLGALEVSGEVLDQPGMGNRLRFWLRSDLAIADVRGWIRSLKAIEAAYPVLGFRAGPAPRRDITQR